MLWYDIMATMTMRATFALDEATVSRIQRLAGHWSVSQAEVIRRSVAASDEKCSETAAPRLRSLHKLREHTAKKKVDTAAWMKLARDSRR